MDCCQLYASDLRTNVRPSAQEAKARDGHGAGVRLHFSDSDLNFWEKFGTGFGMNGMVYIEWM